MQIMKSYFVNNEAIETGGAILIKNVRSLVVDSEFTHNQAQQGGAIFSEQVNEQSTVVDKCLFTNNLAKNEGAVFFWSQSPMSLLINEFEDNICKGVVSTSTYEPDGL